MREVLLILGHILMRTNKGGYSKEVACGMGPAGEETGMTIHEATGWVTAALGEGRTYSTNLSATYWESILTNTITHARTSTHRYPL